MNIETTIENVKSIEMSVVEYHETTDMYTREILIKTKDGGSYVITLSAKPSEHDVLRVVL